MNIAFFDAKPYDIPAFERQGKVHGINFKFFDTRLNSDTVRLAKDFDGVCAFVNDEIDKDYLIELARKREQGDISSK